MNLDRWSPHRPWTRGQWAATRWAIAVLLGLDALVALALGWGWVALALLAFAVWGVAYGHYGERLEHGPRRRGGDPR